MLARTTAVSPKAVRREPGPIAGVNRRKQPGKESAGIPGCLSWDDRNRRTTIPIRKGGGLVGSGLIADKHS